MQSLPPTDTAVPSHARYRHRYSFGHSVATIFDDSSCCNVRDSERDCISIYVRVVDQLPY